MQRKINPSKCIINAADLSKPILYQDVKQNIVGLKRITQHVRNLQGLSQIFSELELILGRAASVNYC